MTVINTNVSASITQNALSKNERAMAKTMEQLSTGKRVNSAADDAAGLAIVSRMTSQIRGLNQAVRNANDGISLLQTYDGAMIEMTNMLQRMRELAVQSASDTNTSTDRSYLNQEFQQLGAELQRIGANTQWNGENILDGTFSSGTASFQVGANASQTIDFTMQDLGGQPTTATAATDTTYTAPTTSAGQAKIVELTLASTTDIEDGDKITFTINNEAQSLEFDVTSAGVISLTGTVALTGITNTSQINATYASGVITLTSAADVTANATAYSGDDFSVSNIRVHRGVSAAASALDVMTRSNSTSAVTALDTQIENVNNYRATAGAVMNRLEYAADNLSNVATNGEASRSRVEDADYAAATTELARTQIIAQAATAMLAQANQVGQNVLSLLK